VGDERRYVLQSTPFEFSSDEGRRESNEMLNHIQPTWWIDISKIFGEGQFDDQGDPKQPRAQLFKGLELTLCISDRYRAQMVCNGAGCQRAQVDSETCVAKDSRRWRMATKEELRKCTEHINKGEMGAMHELLPTACLCTVTSVEAKRLPGLR